MNIAAKYQAEGQVREKVLWYPYDLKHYACSGKKFPVINFLLNTMRMKTTKPETVDAYISQFQKSTQQILSQVRDAIKEGAPDAEEMISYGMPAYKLHGKPLVYFAGYEKHIGFYATPTGHAAFEKQLSKYKQGKGSVQFPLEDAMPLELIRKMVQFRVKEVSNKAKATKSNKKSGITGA